MIVHEETRQNVIDIFTKLKRPLIERNLKQAEVPHVCTVFTNKRGSAPGMVFNKDGKIFVSMAGVPHEMKGLMTDDVIPMLLQKFEFPSIMHRTLMTAGIGESFLAELIKDFEEALPAHIKLAYLPNYGMVRLRLSATGYNKAANEKEISQLFEKLKSLVQDYLVTDEDEPIQNVVGKLLMAKGRTMCTAESCSGGYIAHLVTSIPGSSKFYDGSVVSYSYQAKEDLLQVDKNTLETLGAVSEEVVIQMAKGALKNIKSDYVIAVSGIMGPDGGMPDKPVGTVWVAVGSNEKIETQKLYFRFDRARNIQLTAVNALNMLRKFILAGS
jgi:nicotinamide-nucleotide amidase